MISGNNLLLAIGIDNYRYSADFKSLNNAVNDTKALIDVLTGKYSFELCQDPLFNETATKDNIYAAFNSLVSSCTEEDNLVIFFAGHGVMHPLTRKGYWVPHEARNAPPDFISNSDIKDFLENIPAKHIFLISDSCFSGTFLTTTRGIDVEQSYSDLASNKSRWMLASGSEQKVSDGAPGKSSPFAKYLLRFLKNNDNKYSSVTEIIRYVTVLTAHNSRQQPRGAQIENIGHQGGELVFIAKDEFVKKSIDKTKGKPHTRELLAEINAVYRQKSEIATGKEIVLIQSFIEGKDLLIFELFRFNDQGQKKVSFNDGKIKFSHGTDQVLECTVYARFATWEGFNNYWDNHQDFHEKQVLAIGASDEISRVEESEVAIAHQEHLQDLLDSNQNPMKCLHCGNIISTNDSFLVEIDEIDLKENIGNVHLECLRPVDRVLGKTRFKDIDNEKMLVNFDHKTWVSLIKRGQGFLSGTAKINQQQKIVALGWNKDHAINSGDYCIKMFLENGDSQYVMLGREIHRFHSAKIDAELNSFNDALKESIETKDPLAVTSMHKTFGNYSQLEKIKADSETILKVAGFEKSKFSQQIKAINENIDNDYAPLGLLTIPTTNEILNLGKFIPLISDPAQFETLHNNWNDAGFNIGKCAFKIIESDKDLDQFLPAFFSDGMQPVLNPKFDENKNLVEGIIFSDIKDFIENSESQQLIPPKEPAWKTGDIVKVVFPNRRSKKIPLGKLVSDEFLDDSGVPCVMFAAIESGIVREDLTFKIPSRLLERV